MRAAARERVREIPERIRRGTQTRFLRRWWGLLGTAVQRAVANSILRGNGADIPTDLSERPPRVADLPA